jgi:ABC-type multidrug transport system ATPase subunit
MECSKGQNGLLCFEGVDKSFHSGLSRQPVRALRSLSLTLSAGEALGLVGPNGSGKTTTFRIAAGLLKTDRGKVRVLGEPPGSKRAKQRTGYMPELPGFPGTLTPREILGFIGEIFGVRAVKRRARIEELDKLLALSDYLDRRMGKLSKGMLKRVSLATALFNKPELLLLDEPFEGLDPLGTARMKDHLAGLAGEGTGILVSSHILSDVEALCSRIIVIHEGRVLIEGPIDSILSAREGLQVLFEAPEGDRVLEEVRALIEARGGSVDFAGAAREGLEDLFRRVMADQGEAGP